MAGGGARRSREGELLAGKYRLVKRLGAGGMGAVYRARNEAAGRDVAVKVLHAELAQDEETVKRFLQEARAANKVRHPNVVDVIDVDRETNGAPFIVQELLNGEDLSAVLEELRGRLPPEGALQLLVPVVEAIGVAHLNGVVHRDLKPSNVFLAQQGGQVVPKVLDFGIARIAGEGGVRRITETGIAMGTPAYMAPEVIQRGARAADPRSDVWSIGVMLYEILGGQLPFEAETMSGLFVRICTEEPKPLDEIAPHVPAALVLVVRRCLQRNAAKRYHDASVLARDLRGIQQGKSIAPHKGVPTMGLEAILEAATLHLSSRPPAATPPRIAGLRGIPGPAPIPREMTNPIPGPRPAVNRDAPTVVAPRVDREAATKVAPLGKPEAVPVHPRVVPETRMGDFEPMPSLRSGATARAGELEIEGLGPPGPRRPAGPMLPLHGTRTSKPTPRGGTPMMPTMPQRAEPVLDLASIRPMPPRVSRGATETMTMHTPASMAAGEIVEVIALLAVVGLAAFAASSSGGLVEFAQRWLGDSATLGIYVAAGVAAIFGAGLLMRGTTPFVRIGEVISGAGMIGYAVLLVVIALGAGGRDINPGLAGRIAPWALVGVSGGVAAEGFRRAIASYRSDERRVRMIWFGIAGVVGAIVAAHALVGALGQL